MAESKIVITKQLVKKTYGHDYTDGALDKLAQKVEEDIATAISDRWEAEERMRRALMIYNGEYEPEQLKAMKRSQVFIKVARFKANVAEAQMVDIVMPPTDTNFAMEPTEIVDLDFGANASEPVSLNGRQFLMPDGSPVTGDTLIRRSKEVAEERCRNMLRLIKDQHTECNMDAEQRDVIHNGVKLGTGVLKAPVVKPSQNRRFLETKNGMQMVAETVYKPAATSVFPGNFFPDMSASTVSECEYICERTFMSRKQLRDLKRFGGKTYNKVQLDKVLDMKPDQTQHRPGATDDMRYMMGFNAALNDTRYEVWEYHGVIEPSIYTEITGKEVKQSDTNDDMYGVIYYCGGIVFGARFYPVTYEQTFPYNVWNWEKSDGCIFGKGIPEILEDETDMINSSWRMTMDNAAITAGPQVAVNTLLCEPEDGVYEITPWKVWKVKRGNVDLNQAISKVEFNSRINETMSIYQAVRQMADEVSGVPMIQQGESSSPYQQVGALSILLNAANTVRRRQVKDWDDNITVPMVSGFYAFNMDFSDDASVKGDFKVKARGVSELLVREQQALALTNFLTVCNNSPSLQPLLAIKQKEIIASFVKTQRLDASLIPTADEITDYIEKQKQSQPVDPNVQLAQIQTEQITLKHQNNVELAQIESKLRQTEQQSTNESKMVMAQVEFERIAMQERVELQRLASQQLISEQTLITKMQETEAKLADSRQKFLAEINIKRAMGTEANFGLETGAAT
jgi:hypothetical protein